MDEKRLLKMEKTRIPFSSWFIKLPFFVICIIGCNSEINPQEFYDFISFDRMKNDFFTKSAIEISPNSANTTNDWKCLREIGAIGNALSNYELWASKSKQFI